MVNCVKENRKEGKIGLISLQKLCDKDDQFEGNKVDQDCGVKTYLTEEKEDDVRLLIHYFGSEKYDNEIGTNKFKNNYKDRLSFTHLEDIRKAQQPEVNQPLGEPITQGGSVFKQKSEEFLQNCDLCHLSISLETINVIINFSRHESVKFY